MTTTEVAQFARLSVATILRRVRDRSIDLQPIDGGREYVFLARDVWRVFVPEPAAPAPQASWEGRVNAEEIRAIRSRKKGKAPPKAAVPKPTISPNEHRAVMLKYGHGMSVAHDTDTGLYSVVFAPRRNVRSDRWPARIVLPQANPGPVSLDTVEEFEALAAEADELVAACKADRTKAA